MRRVFTSSILALALITSASAQVAPIAFEDVNNNGVWDAGTDKDITQVIMTQREYATDNSLVITAVLKPPDPQLKLTGQGGCAYLRAKRDIIVNASILCPYYDGNVILLANGVVTVADKVQLVGKNRVMVSALKKITFGNGVRLTSAGGSANQGAVAVTGYDGVAIGSGLIVSGLKDVFIDVRGGHLTIGLGATLTSTQATLRLLSSSMLGPSDITIDGAKLKGTDIDVTSFTGSILYRNGVATVPKTGVTGIYSYVKTIDVTGTRFVGPVATWPPMVALGAKNGKKMATAK